MGSQWFQVAVQSLCWGVLVGMMIMLLGVPFWLAVGAVVMVTVFNILVAYGRHINDTEGESTDSG